MKVATYSRVSPTRENKTAEGIHKSLQESIKQCRAIAEAEGHEVIREYSDQYVSGKDNTAMLSFQEMMDDGRNHEFERLYVRRVDRFGRNMSQSFGACDELYHLGITVKFIEVGIDTGSELGRGMMALLANMAENERTKIIENTTRGREEAMAKGVKFGRKPVERQIKREAVKLDVKQLRWERKAPIEARKSWKQLEEQYGCSTATLIRRLKAAGYWDYEHQRVL